MNQTGPAAWIEGRSPTLGMLRRTAADRLRGEARSALLMIALLGAGCTGHEPEARSGPCAVYADYDPERASAAAAAAVSSSSARFLGVEREDGVHTPGVPELLARGRVEIVDLPDPPCRPSRSRMREYLRAYNQTLRVDPRF